MRRPRAPIALPVIAASLTVLGFVASRVIPTMAPEQQLATNVLLNAIPFILIFVGMFPPWAMAFYTRGFSLLLIATLSYILWSHVTPAFEDVQEEARGDLVTSHA